MAEQNSEAQEAKDEGGGGDTWRGSGAVDEVWSWGAGTEGQLGTGRLEDELLPQLLRLPSLSSTGTVSMLACGGAHVIALTAGGKVLTWGRGTSGQLGHGDTDKSLAPKLVSSFDGVTITHVAAGWSNSGFVSENGCVFTCGDGSFGQLGHGDNTSHSFPVKVEFFVNKNVQQLACGMRHSLVLLKDCPGNKVFGFGSGKRGQLGVSMDKIKSVNLPQLTRGFDDVEITRISANGDHSAALTAEGHLFAWGRGFGGYGDAQLPRRLPSSLFFKEAVLGWNHALLLTDQGELFMLGGTITDLEKPNPDSREAFLEKISNLEGFKVVQIAAGAEHSAIVTEIGETKAWGWGEHGQLGLGDTLDQAKPQLVNLGHEHVDPKEIRVYCGSGFTYVIRRK